MERLRIEDKEGNFIELQVENSETAIILFDLIGAYTNAGYVKVEHAAMSDKGV